MKKFYTFLLGLLLLNSAIGQYNQSTALTVLPGPSGTAITLSLNTSTFPLNDGTLTVYYQGDFDGTGGNLENAEITDENNVRIGDTRSVNQCDNDLDSVVFTIAKATLQSWV